MADSCGKKIKDNKHSMVILHIAYLDDNIFGGVNVAVPQHVIAQQGVATVGLVNLTNRVIDGVDKQFDFSDGFSVKQLPKPFDRPDCVIFHEVYRPAFLKIANELNTRGIPYIVIPHGCLSRLAQKQKAIKKKLGNALLFNRFLDRAKSIQYLSKEECNNSNFGKNKWISGNGITINNTPCKEYRNERQPTLVFIGRLDIHTKGLDLLLKAIDKKKEILGRFNFKILLFGPSIDDSFEKLNSEVKQRNLENLVEIGSALIGDAKKAVLNNADYFIQTSRNEGMPMGILEALSYGIPCVVSENTGVADIIEKENAGYICKADTNSIADVLEKVAMDSDSYAQLSKNAKDTTEKYFDWNVIANRAVNKYFELVFT